MSFGRTVRRQVRGAVAPVALLLVVAYFLWNATQGERGLEARAARERDLANALAEQARADAELARWDRRIAGLRTRIDTDALDERVRAMLNRADPNDVIVPYDKSQRLF
jgi:cell division protein FtsB